MSGGAIIGQIRRLGRGVFTTHELCAVSGKSPQSVIQALNILKKNGVVLKIYRGIWQEAGNERISPYTVIPLLLPRYRSYVSFISALHLYGIIEQIPQVVTLATTGHTKTIHTKAGTYCFHQLHPALFDGFGWYKGTGNFLIAEPEKALVDSLYLSARKKHQFGYFPELHFPGTFSRAKARKWIKKIPDCRIRSSVEKKLAKLL